MASFNKKQSSISSFFAKTPRKKPEAGGKRECVNVDEDDDSVEVKPKRQKQVFFTSAGHGAPMEMTAAPPLQLSEVSSLSFVPVTNEPTVLMFDDVTVRKPISDYVPIKLKKGQRTVYAQLKGKGSRGSKKPDVIILGSGGAGKSALIRQYIQEHRESACRKATLYNDERVAQGAKWERYKKLDLRRCGCGVVSSEWESVKMLDPYHGQSFHTALGITIGSEKNLVWFSKMKQEVLEKFPRERFAEINDAVERDPFTKLFWIMTEAGEAAAQNIYKSFIFGGTKIYPYEWIVEECSKAKAYLITGFYFVMLRVHSLLLQDKYLKNHTIKKSLLQRPRFIFLGCCFQLPPVPDDIPTVEPDGTSVLKKELAEDIVFFKSPVIQAIVEGGHGMYLTTSIRHECKEYADILDRVKFGQETMQDRDFLESLVKFDLKRGQSSFEIDTLPGTHICGINESVKRICELSVARLPIDPTEGTCNFKRVTLFTPRNNVGLFGQELVEYNIFRQEYMRNNMTLDASMKISIGMFVRPTRPIWYDDPVSLERQCLATNTPVYVTSLVRKDGEDAGVYVCEPRFLTQEQREQILDGKSIVVEPHHVFIAYKIFEEEDKTKRFKVQDKYLPVKLAYASSMQSVQGRTFEIDQCPVIARACEAWLAQHRYVVLSRPRVKSLEALKAGFFLVGNFNWNARLPQYIIDFYNSLQHIT